MTQRAYEAAKRGQLGVTVYEANLNLLSEIARRLRELGYSTEIFEITTGNPYVIVRWDTD